MLECHFDGVFCSQISTLIAILHNALLQIMSMGVMFDKSTCFSRFSFVLLAPDLNAFSSI